MYQLECLDDQIVSYWQALENKSLSEIKIARDALQGVPSTMIAARAALIEACGGDK
ncbi:hypothetical protein KBC77_00955 [Candidatus Saccharibacteria bacterium]|nr:hypothetical protein [Candidatus Saccharibacteria bacterium]